MAIPNRKVVNAFIESYLNIRKPHWDLQNEEEVKNLSDNSMIKHKMDICGNLFTQIKNTSTLEEWVQLAIKLKELEQHELGKGKESGNLMFGLFNYVVPEAILAKTLRAMRSYIVSQLADDPFFLRKKRDLTSLIGELENQEKIAGLSQADKEKLDKNRMDLLALTNSKDTNYHKHYFTKVIMLADSKSIELKEAEFSDFEENAKNGRRSDKYLSHPPATMTTINLQKQQKQITSRNNPTSSVEKTLQTLPATLPGVQQDTESKSLLDDQTIFKHRRVTRSQTKARSHRLGNS